MALTPGLDLRQTQRLALTPGMRQGLAVLQLSTLDLWDELRRLAEENPLLELHEPAAAAGGFDFEAAAHPETLAENLSAQIALMPLPPETAALARFLTGDLTEDGYLASSAEELSEALGLPVAQIEAAVQALQSCEPAGVAARDLADCLALQLIDRGEAPDIARAACAHLALLMEGRWSRAARLTGLPRTELERLADLIRDLPPRPAAPLSGTAPPVIPEIAVEEDGQGGFRVVSLHDALPGLRLDAALADQAGASPALRPQLEAAEAALRALRHRADTLHHVARVIVTRQHRFFAQGPDHMAPLTRAGIAAELGLHPSTVGRAIAGKALLFHGAVHPLSLFLSKALPGAVSAHSAQRRLHRLVAEEPADSPLSDEQIAALLQREGVDIARRTVAKYRGCMNIPSSFERKRQKAGRRTGPTPRGLGSPEIS
ncbi:MAG: RNA polymerase factor sigma-54 [Paracoccaceae bacterium]